LDRRRLRRRDSSTATTRARLLLAKDRSQGVQHREETTMRNSIGSKGLSLAAALLLSGGIAAGVAQAQGLGDMGADALKEQAVDKAVDSGASMAKDHAKSAMGMDDAVTEEDIAAEAEADAAEAEAEPAPVRIE
jgi:hypothetical protein